MGGETCHLCGDVLATCASEGYAQNLAHGFCILAGAPGMREVNPSLRSYQGNELKSAHYPIFF